MDMCSKNDQLKIMPMRALQYVYNLIQPDCFTKKAVLSHLAMVDNQIQDLLYLRRELGQLKIPTHSVVSSIRALEEVRSLLLLSVTKKLLTRNDKFHFPDQLVKKRAGWRDMLNLFFFNFRASQKRNKRGLSILQFVPNIEGF